MLLVGGLCLFPVTGHLRATEAPAAAVQQRGTVPSPETAFQAVLRRYCVGCHNQRTLTAGLALDTADLANVGAHADLWEGVVRKLRAGLMPPAGRPRPDTKRPTTRSPRGWNASSTGRRRPNRIPGGPRPCIA